MVQSDRIVALRRKTGKEHYQLFDYSTNPPSGLKGAPRIAQCGRKQLSHIHGWGKVSFWKFFFPLRGRLLLILFLVFPINLQQGEGTDERKE
ncbi:hypothetical protein CDAR_594241 [Caerostris darwini]|uniref:Uncharacterized protein n=1 Tax=Caerostris darwini TaxID=1538125 RepID=A0AAV4PBL5_9ARAC|nr:hypothetical protein CDAR_594241 [Caerostris darwini]